MIELDFVLNMKVVIMCLSFLTSLRLLILDALSESYTNNIKDYSCGMGQKRALGLLCEFIVWRPIRLTFFLLFWDPIGS